MDEKRKALSDVEEEHRLKRAALDEKNKEINAPEYPPANKFVIEYDIGNGTEH